MYHFNLNIFNGQSTKELDVAPMIPCSNEFKSNELSFHDPVKQH